MGKQNGFATICMCFNASSCAILPSNPDVTPEGEREREKFQGL